MSENNLKESRPIPPLPGGGSWRFDEVRWKWIDTSPAPAEPAEQLEVAPETPIAEQE